MNLFAFRLVLRRLRHEWLGSACLCFAIGAAIIPLLLILGLKEGTMATLRQRLASDPVNLEVRMPRTTALTRHEVQQIRDLPGVGFCVPCTRALAASAMLYPVNNPAEKQESYLIATADGDPLLQRYACPVPQEGEIVIGSAIADKTGLTVGQRVTVEASCRMQGRLVRSGQECKVVGILPPESGASKQSFVPLSLVIGVEEFVEGLRHGIDAVSGGVIPQPVYHGIWLDTPAAIGKMRAGMWGIACPFKEQRDPSTQEIQAGCVKSGSKLFFNTAQFVQADKLRQAYSLARQQSALLELWNPPLEAALTTNGKQRSVLITAAPAPLTFENAPRPEFVARCADAALAGEHILHMDGGQSSVALRISQDAGVPAGEIRVSAQLLGMLYQIRHRHLGWNPEHKRFEQNDRTFSRVRLYASGLEAVEPLVDSMTRLGYHAIGNISEIRRVQELDSQLKVLFALIAGIGVVGAACSLALCLFNSTLKHQREYAILSTLGTRRRVLFLFPVYEAVILTLVSLGISFAAFHGMAGVIAHLFAAEIGGEESLCCLSPQLHCLVIAIGLSVSFIAALGAACVTLKAQPSTSIRET